MGSATKKIKLLAHKKLSSSVGDFDRKDFLMLSQNYYNETSIQYSLWGGGGEDLEKTSSLSVTLPGIIVFTLLVHVGCT